ncbi:MAG: hypothetical protein AAB343_02740 [Patescibacteria group bacterium]
MSSQEDRELEGGLRALKLAFVAAVTIAFLQCGSAIIALFEKTVTP